MAIQLLCVDIDNVIARTDEVMRQLIRDFSSEHVNLRYEDVTDFDYCLCQDLEGRRLSRDGWTSIHARFSEPVNILSIRPYDGVQANLATLATRYEIHLVTSRLPKAKAATIKWLERFNMSAYPLHFVEHRKKHACSIQFNVAIDDDGEQANSFAALGVPVLLLAHPWNVAYGSSLVKRAASWDELVKELLML